jgi:prolyl oligopeptidase
MNKIIFSLLFFCQIVVCQTIIETKKVPTETTFHTTTIVDNYAWLEKINSDEVKNWVKQENDISQAELKKIIRQYDFEKTIRKYDLQNTSNFPIKKGNYFFSKYYTEKDKPSSLYYRKKIDDEPTLLINPWTIYKNNNAFIESYYPSKSSDIIAFKINTDGSDVKEIRFINTIKKDLHDDVLKNVKFSNVEWNLDYGVFYKKNINQNRIEKDSTFQLMYHKLGTSQDEDKIIYDASKNKTNFSFFTTRDKLIVSDYNKITNNIIFYRASLSDESFELTPLFEKNADEFDMIYYKDDKVYYSSKKYEWGDVRSFNVLNTEEEKVIVPQYYNYLLLNTYITENYIFCVYKNNSKYSIKVFDAEGNYIRHFDAPEGIMFRIRYYDKGTNSLFVEMDSYAIYAYNFKLNLSTGVSSPYFNNYIKAKATLFPFNYFETKNTTFKSADGKDVPITIVYKKGITLDGKNPTLLSAYGGFGVVSLPYYSTSLLSFLEKGGIYAFAEIRGGGEKGNKWATDGKGRKKTNSFNDFIGAAEYLIKENYTSPNKLAISGGSNGGLVVGVAMTKRPDLFKVVIPKMGVFDMLKFDQYTIGSHHYDEYGNPKNPDDFDTLYGYSPFHNIKEDINYPTTLIITSDNDDRVVPLHSYKFAAALQNRTAQKNPIYLLEYNDAGHYGKVSTYDYYVKREADFYSFLWYPLNN